MARARRLAVAFSLALATSAVAQPPSCGPGGAFPDVPQSHPFCAWIQQLAADQIAATCDGTHYCPDAPVTRAQLALFLYRLSRGTTTSQVDADTLDGIDSSGFGDITGVSTPVGSGLAGGAASGAVSLSIPTAGVNSDRIENGTILFEDLAGNSCANNSYIKWSGSAWTCATAVAPVAFLHTVTNNDGSGFPNYGGGYTWLNHPSLNGNPNVFLFVTARANADTRALSVFYATIGGGVGDRWTLYHPDTFDFVPGQTFNILIVQP
jgi:hypothetical protein